MLLTAHADLFCQIFFFIFVPSLASVQYVVSGYNWAGGSVVVDSSQYLVLFASYQVDVVCCVQVIY